MFLIPSETPEEIPTPAQQIAKNLIEGLGRAKAEVSRVRSSAAQLLWKSVTRDSDSVTGAPRTIPVSPIAIVTVMSPKEARAMVVTDILQRANLAYTETVHVSPENRVAAMVQAFQTLSPVPSTHDLLLKDGAAATVDVSAEVVALLAKLATVESISVVTKP